MGHVHHTLRGKVRESFPWTRGSPIIFTQGLWLNHLQDAYWLIFRSFARSSWEGAIKWHKSHRGRYSTAYLRNKTESEHIQDTVSPAAEAILQKVKSSQIFQKGNRSHSFVGDFVFPRYSSRWVAATENFCSFRDTKIQIKSSVTLHRKEDASYQR